MLIFANPILIAAAVIPAVVLLVYIYRTDRLEKEPSGLLFSLLLSGVISTFLAALAEELGLYLFMGRFDKDSPFTTPYSILLLWAVRKRALST